MKYLPTLIVAAALAGLASCANPHRPASQGTPVRDLVRQAQAANDNAGLSSEAKLAGLTRVAVAGDANFEVAARTAQITRYPCSRCHDRPIAQMRSAAQSVGKKSAHWDIAVRHAAAEVMSCTTCHQLEGATDQLRTLEGNPVDFNHSYQLCGQCHSKQAADWKGGAHGKRLGGWAPPRVVENCTGCHNPHSPRFPTRWPSVAKPIKQVSLPQGSNHHE